MYIEVSTTYCEYSTTYCEYIVSSCCEVKSNFSHIGMKDKIKFTSSEKHIHIGEL